MDEKVLIALYETGKSDLELAEIFNTSERSIQRLLAQLRLKKKIKARSEILTSKTVSFPIKREIDFTPVDWNIVKSSAKTNKKEFKQYLVIADTHVPHEDQKSIKAILKLTEDIKFDGFFILGDFLECESVSHWLHDKHKNKTLEGKRLEFEYKEGNRLLDEFDKRLPVGCDKRFWMGNHERFVEDVLEKMPQLDGLINVIPNLKLKERGYIVYEEQNHIEKVGKLNIFHGWKGGENPTKSMITQVMGNVLSGHLHTLEVKMMHSPAKELSTIGISMPCLATQNPDFMKNQPNKFSLGFCIINYYDGGFFQIDILRIIKSKFIYNNKLYSGGE